MFDFKRIYTLKFKKRHNYVYGNKMFSNPISDREICDILKELIAKYNCKIISMCLGNECETSKIRIICNTKDKYSILFDFANATKNKIERLKWR